LRLVDLFELSCGRFPLYLPEDIQVTLLVKVFLLEMLVASGLIHCRDALVELW
jgi:hypothetical protein